MDKTISASSMRDKLLARLSAPAKTEDWVRILAIPGHRELLTLIALHQPSSVGALAELARRAQPNVSRALNSLVAANLVEVVVTGRRSVPRVTELGAAKAKELRLLEGGEIATAPTVQAAELFSVEIAEPVTAIDETSTQLEGLLTTWIWLNSQKERVAARTKTDLDELGNRLLGSWWRIFYRRDAPFRLWDFELEEQPGSKYSLIATILGSRLNLTARNSPTRMLDLSHASTSFPVSMFENLFLDEVIRSVATCHWLKGRNSLPLHNLLSQVDDTRNDPGERTFFRTAGALGLAFSDLDANLAGQVRQLLELVPDEDARLDFSSAVLADWLAEGQLWTEKQLELHRERNAMPRLVDVRVKCAGRTSASVRPYKHGYNLAKEVRAMLKLAEDRAVGGTQGLSALFGTGDNIALSPDAPGALRAFQSIHNGSPTIIVENEGRQSSAFVLARSIGDFVAFGSSASCVADLYTERQAVGRAFAAEFLAPGAAVVHLIEDEGRSVAQIADHYGVSTSVVHRQYENSAQ